MFIDFIGMQGLLRNSRLIAGGGEAACCRIVIVQLCAYTRVHGGVAARVCVYVYVFVLVLCVCVCMYLCVCVYVLVLCVLVNVCMCVCMCISYVCMCCVFYARVFLVSAQD